MTCEAATLSNFGKQEPPPHLISRLRRRLGLCGLGGHDELLDVVVVRLVVVVEGGGVDAEGRGRVGLAAAAHRRPLEVERGVVVVGAVVVVVQQEAATGCTTLVSRFHILSSVPFIGNSQCSKVA